MKSDWTLVYLSCLAFGGCFGIIYAMLSGGGLANFNKYNEGWIEAGMYGIGAILGFRRIYLLDKKSRLV